mmetsp:Transcript_28096/g.41799  ORF Transcript_28096/g.41799 Transcript_28096/m.41799 type:complete len:98 (-) Transcript_28096:320-613(-)
MTAITPTRSTLFESSSNPQEDQYTMSASLHSSARRTPVPRRRSASSNPVVRAMLNSNIMHTCDHVREMYSDCVNSKERTAICDTATFYFVECAKSQK